MNLLLLGSGKTGSLVAEIARERGHNVLVVTSAKNQKGSALTSDSLAGLGSKTINSLVIVGNTSATLGSNTLKIASGGILTIGGSAVIVGNAGNSIDFGTSNGERRHAVVASGSVLLPYAITVGAVWTARSQVPWSALAGRDLNGDTFNTDLVPGTTRNSGISADSSA